MQQFLMQSDKGGGLAPVSPSIFTYYIACRGQHFITRVLEVFSAQQQVEYSALVRPAPLRFPASAGQCLGKITGAPP